MKSGSVEDESDEEDGEEQSTLVGETLYTS